LTLSGVTPGHRVGLRFRRGSLHCAHAQKSSRKVGLVGAFSPPLIMPLTAVAAAFLAGEQTVDQLIQRITRTLGHDWRWIPRVARRFVKAFPSGKTRPRQRDVVRFLLRDRSFRRALRKMSVDDWLAGPPRMQPVTAAAAWPVPPIETVGALADYLALALGDLEWFGDLHFLNRKGRPQLRHYHYRVLTKQSGALRLIEAPKPRLKELQRKILSSILEKIPPHPAVHGFLKGHSIRTFVTPHVGQRVVLKMDLEDFFPSISGARIQALFRTAGYPEAVADLLGGICTTVVPHDIWKARDLYSQSHLPQGAPTSPAWYHTVLRGRQVYSALCGLEALRGQRGSSARLRA